ncbi:hypothetical protein [Kordiimonas sp.]|uniref:hypothetical protein n=1 Tax=Kordiimonas sp. TaxID=1970157 RepID=UPI003A8F1104
MRTKVSAALLLTAAMLLASCASSRSDKQQRHPQIDKDMDPARMEAIVSQYIDRWDYNNDGAATCEDINVSRSRLFRLLDEDKNAVLTSGEYRHAKFEDKSFLFFYFIRIDSNGDGAVSLDEVIAVPHSQFMAVDKNADCSISPQEAMASMRDSRARDHQSGGRGRPEGREGKRPR